MTDPEPLPITLGESDRAALTEHFLALDSEDRRLRFGASISETAIRSLDERIDFGRDAIFAIAGEDLCLVAVVHVAHYEGRAELGLSVLSGHRGRGLGNALFARAVMHLRNRGIREVFVHCLAENGAMMRLARRNRMRLARGGGEADATLVLAPATPDSLLAEWFRDLAARFTHGGRRDTRRAIDTLKAITPHPVR